MSKQRRKGTAFETACRRYLSERLGKKVERTALKGRADDGDLDGVDFRGRVIVIECKNHREYDIAGWMKELEREVAAAGADLGVVMFKRKKVGDMGKQLVLMDTDTFTSIIGGN